ncbi:MAG: zinc-binding dehydrogenase [Fuerstiella sp.]|nr:zinc-binding dehydrogenase [Fuerstiella sp.]
MKAAILREFGQPLSVEEIETPRPNADEVLIKVRAAGIDGTDLKLIEGFGYRPDLPFTTGHESAGVIHEVGTDVTDFSPGDRVITYNFATCGNCLLCRSNREQLCPNMTGIVGVRAIPGGHAEFLKLPARQVVSFPETISFSDAAVLCDAGITALHAVERSELKSGETVAIIGVGGVGSYAIQFAKLTGARVIAVDVTNTKTARSLELGASAAINSSRQDVVREIRQLTDGDGVDCVIDVVGRESTIAAGVESLRNGGRVVIVGYTPENYALSGKRIAQNELQIIGTRCGRKQDLMNTVRLVAEGKTHSIVTDQLPFEEINEALCKLRAGEVLGRLVLQMPETALSTTTSS